MQRHPRQKGGAAQKALGRKRRFGLAGGLNALLTNLVLQFLLLSPGIPASLCTLISQLVNGWLGFMLYGRWVFQGISAHQTKPMLRYATLQTALWQLNWLLINTGHRHGLQRNIAGVIAIAPLATASYLIQKNWVFRAS